MTDRLKRNGTVPKIVFGGGSVKNNIVLCFDLMFWPYNQWTMWQVGLELQTGRRSV